MPQQPSRQGDSSGIRSCASILLGGLALALLVDIDQHPGIDRHERARYTFNSLSHCLPSEGRLHVSIQGSVAYLPQYDIDSVVLASNGALSMQTTRSPGSPRRDGVSLLSS